VRIREAVYLPPGRPVKPFRREKASGEARIEAGTHREKKRLERLAAALGRTVAGEEEAEEEEREETGRGEVVHERDGIRYRARGIRFVTIIMRFVMPLAPPGMSRRAFSRLNSIVLSPAMVPPFTSRWMGDHT
jgi:hypothetical protein